MWLRSAPRPWFRGCLAVIFALAMATVSYARHGAAKSRLTLFPHFQVGEVFRYGIQMNTDSASHARGPIVDPEGATRLSQSVSVTLRLQILSVSGSAAAPGPVRIRATYEQAAGTTSSDSYDPNAGNLEKEFQRLQGHSMEFTLHPDGTLSNITGLREIVSNPSRAAIVSQWLSQLTIGASLPKQGIAVGETWLTEQPLEHIPLQGLVWRTKSIYSGDESCPGAALQSSSGAGQAVTPAPKSEECAIIRTQSRIVASPGEKDRTPPAYRKNGLRTFGEWSGKSEGLTAISLRTGMVRSVTQSGSVEMDFTIMSATAQNQMRYAGDVHSQSQITLLSETRIP